MTRLRSLLFAGWMWGSALVICLLCLPALLDRRAAAVAGRAWAWSVLWGARTICGLRYELRGRERLPRGAGLVVAKHSSAMETFVLMAELPDACFVLKEELRRIPLFGWYTRAAGFVFVDRLAGASAMRAMTHGARAAARWGGQLVIFPEGTRAPPGAAPRYLPGAAALSRGLSLPCVPVAHDAGAYWRPGTRLRPGTATFEVLDALPADTPRRALMAGLEEVIEGATNALYARAPAPEAPARDAQEGKT